MSEEKNKIEALLFSSGRKMTEEEIVKLTKIKPEKLKEALEELRRDYESKEGSLSLFNEGDCWKLMTKEAYLPIVQNIVSETELDKALMETLAVIAWKYPILQADVIKIRNNKAYDHLRELEEAGFIVREKQGRTRTIKLTPKFFEYFQLPPSKAKTQDAFKELVPDEIKEKVEQAEQEIEETEQKIEEMNKQKEELEQKRREEKEKKKEIDLVDDLGKETELEQYDVKEEEKPKEEHKLGKLDTYEEGEEAVSGEPRVSEAAAEQRAEKVEKEEITEEEEKEISKMMEGRVEEEEKEEEKSAEDDIMPTKETAEDKPGEETEPEAEEESTEEPVEEESQPEETSEEPEVEEQPTEEPAEQPEEEKKEEQ